MPNNQLHDTRTTVPANRVATAVALAADYVEASQLSEPVITATASSSSAISLALTTPTSGATHYVIERSTDQDSWASVDASVLPVEFPYSDTGLSASTLYYYRAKASDGVNESGYSSVTSDTTHASAGQLSHGDTVARSITGLGGRTVTEYEFQGGASSHLELTAVGQDASFGNWKIEQDNDYGANNPDPFIIDDAERGHVWTKFVNDGGVLYDGTFQYNLDSEIPENTRFRVTYMVKNGPPTGTGQWKMVRVQKRGADDYPGVFLFNYNNGNGDILDYSPGNSDSGQVYWVSGTLPDSLNTWVKYVLEIDTGTQGQQDGYWHIYHVDSSGRQEVASTAVREWGDWPGPMEVYSDTQRYDAIVWQNFVGTGMSEMDVYHDDLTIQVGSWASIELGNSATYNSCTVLEEQKILSWAVNGSATDVQFELNKGGLAAGSYWLHYRDDSGALVHTESVEIS